MAKAQLGSLLQQIRRMASDAGAASDGELLHRFARERDEAAFVTLLQRHGSMVLHVCRRVARQEQDAEDAFQATFLLLAGRPGAIRKQASVASWLHGVAYRLALATRSRESRRQTMEQHAADRQAAAPTPETNWQELQALLDESLQHVPPRYREPLVLCYLQGKTQEEAAQVLGCPLGTVRSRLGRGRERLKQVLERRGIHSSATGLAGSLVAHDLSAAMPAGLVHSTTRAALGYLTGTAPASLVSAQAALLIKNGVRAMATAKLKMAVVLLFALGVIGAGITAVAAKGFAGAKAMDVQAPIERNDPPAMRTPAPAGKIDRADSTPARRQPGEGEAVIEGRVVDPQGKPVPGTKVFFARYMDFEKVPPAQAQDTTDTDGRFRLRVSRTGYQDYQKAEWMRGAVVAVGKQSTFAWVGGDDVEKLTDVKIQLGRDEPIEGRLLDLQGKPIAGVRVQPVTVHIRDKGGDLDEVVKSLKSRPDPTDQNQHFNNPNWPRMIMMPDLVGVARAVITGADGRFRLTGLPGECIVRLRFEGPTIETTEVYAMTRRTPSVFVPPNKLQLASVAWTFHGSTFDHALAPTRVVTGHVRDRDTGAPLAGVTIRYQSIWGAAEPRTTTTDAQGTYQLIGLSVSGKHELLAVPPQGLPYLPAGLTVQSSPEPNSATLDFKLRRGVVIRGRVTDKETGKPVPSVVEYFAFDDNRFLREAPGYRDSVSVEVSTAADGSFTLLGLPGHGILAGRAADPEQGRYMMAVGADKIQGPRGDHGDFITHPVMCDTPIFNTLIEINPAKNVESVTHDLTLDPGGTVTGTIVGPNGQPVVGASIRNLCGVHVQMLDLPSAQFRIQGIDPDHPRAFYFRSRDEKLGAAMVFKGDEQMPVTVRLQKCATITGRVVDQDGRPCFAVLSGSIHKGQLNLTHGAGVFNVTPAKDGRCRVEGILPGLKMDIWAGDNYSYFDQHLVPEFTLQPGEERDLGDLIRKPGK